MTDRANLTLYRARRVLDRLGKPEYSFVCGGLSLTLPARVYRDGIVEIKESADYTEFEVVKLGKIENPVLMYMHPKGIIRYHGEARYIEPHIDALSKSFDDPHDAFPNE